MPDFVNISIQTDESQLVDVAVQRLATTFEGLGVLGWAPSDSNLETILLQAVSAIAADVAQVAAIMPAAAFRAFGTKLLGVAYNQGAAATVQTTWTLADTAGHTIPAGTYLTINSLGFYTQVDTVVPVGTGTAMVLVVAVEQAAAYNGYSTPVALVESIDWVTSVAVIGQTSGGADAEDDVAYQNRLAAELALQAPRPITANDYAAMALSAPASILPAGVVVGRATSIDGYNPTVTTFTATTTTASNTLTAVSSVAGISAGSQIAGAGIPAGTTATAVGTTTVTLSANATASATVTLTSTGSYNNPRSVTTFVTDRQGQALTSAAMSALQTWLQAYREINFLVFVQPPSYTTIYVTYEVHPLPGYDSTALIASVNAAIAQYFNPFLWGNTQPLATGLVSPWLNSQQGFNVVRYNKLLGVIEAVGGVDYVPPGSAGLAIGTASNPTGVVDLTLGGPAPLPSVSVTATPTITVVGSVA